MKKVLTLLFVFVAIGVFHSSALAQIIDPSTGEFSFDLTNCRGGTSMVRFFDLTDSPDPDVFSFSLTIDGNTRRFTLDNRNFNADELDNADVNSPNEVLGLISDSAWRSFVEFYLRELGCLGSGVFGSTQAVTSDPVVNQSIQVFQNIAFSGRAQPRAAQASSPQAQRREAAREDQAEEEGDAGQKALLSQVSSDVEYEFFELNNLGGENLAVRAGFAQTSANGRWSFGFNGIYNRLSFDGRDPFNNGFFNVFINRVTSASLSQESIIGLNVSYLYFDGADNGFGVALHSVRRWYFGGGSVFTLGTMAQFAQVGDLSNGYINFAGLLGFPIGRRLALNLDALLLWNVVQLFDGDQRDLDDPIVLNPGAYLMILFGDAFALNLGARTVLLIKDYTSYELVLGAGFRF